MEVNREHGDAFELNLVAVKDSTSHIPYPRNDHFQNLPVLSDSDDSDVPPSTQGNVLYTLDEERAIVKKLDRRLVLFVAALYLLSFLDRSSKSTCQVYTK